MKFLKVCLLLIIFSLNVETVQSADIFKGAWRSIDEKFSNIEGLVLGVGAITAISEYKGIDNDIEVVPVIIGKYKKLYFDGTSLGLILNDDDKIVYSVLLKPRIMGYDASDSSFFRGMEDRDWSIDAGFRVSLNKEEFLLDLTLLQDILSKHDGQSISAVISKELFEGFITPRVGVKWYSEHLTQYYYGVRRSEATAARGEYRPDSSINFIAGATAALPLGEKWALIGDVEYEVLADEIQDSPLVDENDIFTYLVSLVYRF